eukprot:COSAG05_NODE_7127_length_853_cov_0.698939_1_plen_106_part_01
MRWEGLQFQYPAAAKRVLGDTTTIYTPGKEARNHSTWNCTFSGSDGAPLVVQADGVRFRNSLLEFNDWTAVTAGTTPGAPKMSATLMMKGRDLLFSRNTMRHNGCS